MIAQHARCLWCLLKLGVEIHLHPTPCVLISLDLTSAHLEVAIACLEDNKPWLRLDELQPDDSTVLHGRQFGHHTLLIQVRTVIIGSDQLVVVVGAHHPMQLSIGHLCCRECEARVLAVIDHNQWQPADHALDMTCPVGIEAEHAIGQVHSGISGFEQMTDVAHIGVDIVNQSSGCSNGCQCHQRQHDDQ